MRNLEKDEIKHFNLTGELDIHGEYEDTKMIFKNLEDFVAYIATQEKKWL